MIRSLINNNKTYNPLITNYYNKCLFSTTKPNNGSNNLNNIFNKINNKGNEINKDNSRNNDKETIDNNADNTVIPQRTNFVKKEILEMFEEDLFESKIQKEAILIASEFKAKKEKEWGRNILNFSPYLRMVGLNNRLTNPIEKYLLQLPQHYYYKYLLDCDSWIDQHLIKYQVCQQLMKYFRLLNQRDQSSLKEITTPWLFKMLSNLINNLSTYDQLNTNFHFNITDITSVQRGLIQRSADKLYITFHFILNGELGVNEYTTDISNNFKCSVVFESIIPESKRSSDFRWKLVFIDPSVLSIYSVESLVPILK